MSDFDLFAAVAHVTGEDSHEIRRRGFVLDDSHDLGTGLDHDPECLFDLIDLPESGTVDWDEVLTGAGYGCREPFYRSSLRARRKVKAADKARVKTAVKKKKKQLARAAA